MTSSILSERPVSSTRSEAPVSALVKLAPAPRDLHQAAVSLGNNFALHASARDSERRLPHAEMQQLALSGILAARVPRAFGGAELNIGELTRIMVLIAKGDPNIAQAMQPHACGVEKVRLYGTAEQQSHFFGLVQAGELITNASAERGGAFVGEIRTAIRRGPPGQGWLLNGTKHYSTGSLYAGYFYVLVNRFEGDEAVPTERSLVIVPSTRAGVTVLDDWDGMGQRTTASGTTQFDAVLVQDSEHFPLPQPGAKRTYEGAFAQILHAAIDTGIALAALEDAARYGREKARPVADAQVSRAGDDPFVQTAVGEMAMLAHGAEALVERAAKFLDAATLQFLAGEASERALGEASVAVAEAKMAANNAALQVSEMLYRVGGAGATVRSLNFDRHWRNARTHTTHDPVSYKAKAVGDFYLNDRLPPINTKI